MGKFYCEAKLKQTVKVHCPKDEEMKYFEQYNFVVK